MIGWVLLSVGMLIIIKAGVSDFRSYREAQQLKQVVGHFEHYGRKRCELHYFLGVAFVLIGIIAITVAGSQ